MFLHTNIYELFLQYSEEDKYSSCKVCSSSQIKLFQHFKKSIQCKAKYTPEELVAIKDYNIKQSKKLYKEICFT